MNVRRLRQEIPACHQVIYLNTGWQGPSPQTVVAAIRERLALESAQGPTSPGVLDSAHEMEAKVRHALAQFLGARPEEICLTQNTTEGINLVLNGLRWRPGEEIITTDLEHSSVLVPCYYLQKRRRVKVRVVPLAGEEAKDNILTRLESAVTPKTRLLCLSHIMYANGLRLPLKEIQEMAHDRGAWVLVDGAQSVGQIPVNLTELGSDYYAFPGHKWLLGPAGVGGLFVRQDLIAELEPTLVAQAAVTTYDRQGHWKPCQDSLTKFRLTTYSPALWAGLLAALDFIQSTGVGEISARVRLLTERLQTQLREVPGVSLLSPQSGESASGLVCFAVEGVAPQEVVSYLWEKARVVARKVDYPANTRLSVAFFNTEEELRRVAAALRSLKGTALPKKLS